MDELMQGAKVKLSNQTLGDLPETVLRPRYDRNRVTPGIVHIGVGNFHRAHQAWYLHRLMQRGVAMDWGILGGGVRQQDAEMREKLKAQDCLTTLIQLDADSTSAEVTGVMLDFLPVEPGHTALIQAMRTHGVRIVSLTITEGGYYLKADGSFDAEHPDMQHDANNPERPHSVFGAIIAALRARRASGQAAFTLLSCDNLQGNGNILRQTVLGLADMSDPDLADWIAQTSAFPNSMVDCIVPATGQAEIQVARDLGIDDAAPVTHEAYRQWVIEDSFPTGRPAWEAVGATFTNKVHDYEQMKIRVLNAGHQVLANAGEVLSIETIADCMDDADVATFFRKVQRDEILPFVPAIPDNGSEAYLALIERRFANSAIRDTTRRVAFDGSARHPGFVLPIVRDALDKGAEVRGLMLVEALWARMCAGIREDGAKIAPNDPNWAELTEYAAKARVDPAHWLYQRGIYGDLAEQADLVAVFGELLSSIWANGVRATLRAYIAK